MKKCIMSSSTSIFRLLFIDYFSLWQKLDRECSTGESVRTGGKKFPRQVISLESFSRVLVVVLVT